MAWYWILLIVLGAVSALYVAFSLFAAKILLRQATRPVAHTLDEARVYQSEKENIDFSVYDNVWKKEKFQVDGVHGKIHGEIVFNEVIFKPAKVAIICHGHTWNRLNSLKYANIFYKNGYNLVIYDHGYFGESDGYFTSLGDYERHDLSSVITHVRKVFGEDAFIGLHGESMGAATVLLELGLRDDVNFVVADCPFSDTMSYYRELCRSDRHIPDFPIIDFANAFSMRKYGYDFRNVSPIKAVSKTKTPICFIHGKCDKFIFPSHSEKMYKVCQNPLSELHLVDGAAHAESYHVNPVQYDEIVTKFTQKVESTAENLQLSK